MVTSFKLKQLASLVGIAFLSRLVSLQVGLDAMNYLLLKISCDPRMELRPTRTHTCCILHRANDHIITEAQCEDALYALSCS
jgi:hypothetical protein